MIYNLFHNEEAERKDKQGGIIIFSGAVKVKNGRLYREKNKKTRRFVSSRLYCVLRVKTQSYPVDSSLQYAYPPRSNFLSNSGLVTRLLMT